MEINEKFVIKYQHLKVYFLFKNLLYIGVYLIYNVVLVSGPGRLLSMGSQRVGHD